MPMISLLFPDADGAAFNYFYLEKVHFSNMLEK